MRMGISKSLIKKMTDIRRDFHMYPEAGWTEFRTTAKIYDALAPYGYDIHFCKDFLNEQYVLGREINYEIETARAVSQGADPETIKKMGCYPGMYADLDTGRAGPLTVLRFDIDCVDINETDDSSHLPTLEGFMSKNPGRMHACAHDGHAAVGIVLAEALADSTEKLRGKVRFIFQPAEEGVRGGYAIASSGLVDGADYFIAMHYGLGAPTGTVYGGAKGFLCSAKFDALFKGKSAHAGGEPEKGRNALLAAASAALNLHAIPPHSGGITRINVGVLNAGEGRNVVPQNAVMKIETRGSTDKTAAYMLKSAERVLKGAAEMYGVELRIEKQGETISASSSEGLSALIADEALSINVVHEAYPEHTINVSDDACWMMRRVQEHGGKAAYVIVGADLAAGHHNDHFDFDEQAMPIALELLRNVVVKINGA